jgi:hypothetical protein
MSDAKAAVSLVNAVLMEAIPDFRPVVSFTAADPVLPAGLIDKMRMDFHGRADGDRHVIIDMQARAEDYRHKHALFDAATGGADAAFRGRRGDEAPGSSRDSAPPSVYAIQLLNYDLRTLPREVRPDPDFAVPGGIYSEKIGGVYLVRIKLAWFTGTFPVPERVTSNWTTLEWSCYVLRFSDRFTAGEIKRCQQLGLPPEVAMAFAALRRAWWSETMQREYRDELASAITNFAELGRVQSEERQARVEGALLGFVIWFLSTGCVEKEVVQEELPKAIPETLVRQIWRECEDPRKVEELYRPFLRALRETDLEIK